MHWAVRGALAAVPRMAHRAVRQPLPMRWPGATSRERHTSTRGHGRHALSRYHTIAASSGTANSGAPCRCRPRQGPRHCWQCQWRRRGRRQTRWRRRGNTEGGDAPVARALDMPSSANPTSAHIAQHRRRGCSACSCRCTIDQGHAKAADRGQGHAPHAWEAGRRSSVARRHGQDHRVGSWWRPVGRGWWARGLRAARAIEARHAPA